MKTAKLFKNGRSQAVRLPKEMRFEDAHEVKITRDGKRVILEPIEEFTWKDWWETWKPLGETFLPKGRQQPPMQKRKLKLD